MHFCHKAVISILDDCSNIIVEYTYDAWGKVNSITGNETIGNLNPVSLETQGFDIEVTITIMRVAITIFNQDIMIAKSVDF